MYHYHVTLRAFDARWMGSKVAQLTDTVLDDLLRDYPSEDLLQIHGRVIEATMIERTNRALGERIKAERCYLNVEPCSAGCTLPSSAHWLDGVTPSEFARKSGRTAPTPSY